MGLLRPDHQPRRPRLLRPPPRRRRPTPPSPARPGQPPRRHPPRLPTPPQHLRRTPSLGTPTSHNSGLTRYDPGMSSAPAAIRSESPHARRHAVYVCDRHRQQYPTVGDHRLAVVVPVRVFAGDVAVQGNQRFDSVVVDRERRRCQLRGALGDGIRPAVVGADQQRSPRVAAQVAGLGPRLGDRHLNGDVAGVKVIRHVGQLWTSVALDSCQHAERIVGDHGQQLVVEHLASHVESLLVDARYHQLMTRYAAFLRGVNVGGVNLKMADVADALAEAGFANVRTILASGNIVLESRAGADAVRTKAETALRKRFGYDAWVLVYPIETVRTIVAAYPFEAELDGYQSYVTFVSDTGVLDELAALADQAGADEKITPGPDSAGVIYWQVPKNHTLDSTMGKTMGKKRYKSSTTTRNVRTLAKVLR